MKKDRLGLVMIAASLIAIAIVVGLLYRNQIKLSEEKVRIHGVALTRALSSAESSQGSKGSETGSLARSLVNVQDNEQFAYVVIVNLVGEKLYEATSPGSIVPIATLPSEPYAWFGEHNLTSLGDGRRIREFFAPIIKEGQLSGFVRAGYYSEPRNMLAGQMSGLGLMALPIFLLTTLSYLLIRREIKPLGQLTEKIEQTSLAYGARLDTRPHEGDMDEFIQRFNQFMQLVQSRAEQMGKESVYAKTTAHLLSYKQEKAESALRAIPDGVVVIDDECTATFANQKMEPLLGASPNDIIGRQPHEWCKNNEVLGFLMRYRNATAAVRSSSLEYTPEGRPDSRIAISAFPLFSPRDQSTLYGMLIVFRDISREFLAKQAGAEFVSHVSHELKTPLNTLATYSELLLGYASLTEEDRVDAVNVIHGEVERMAGLINNLLSISKAEMGTLKLVRTRVKLHDLLQDVFDAMSSNARGKGVELELRIPPDLGSVRLDKELFRIAINNLVSNAIKYSNQGGKVTLAANLLDDDQMQISVRDQGIGIARDECEKVFLKYYRVGNSETASRSGHGLGLYLAKQIIELHHGSIAVNSVLGQGTEFTVTFNAQPVLMDESQAL